MKILQTELETVTPEKAQQYLDLVDFGVPKRRGKYFTERDVTAPLVTWAAQVNPNDEAELLALRRRIVYATEAVYAMEEDYLPYYDDEGELPNVCVVIQRIMRTLYERGGILQEDLSTLPLHRAVTGSEYGTAFALPNAAYRPGELVPLNRIGLFSNQEGDWQANILFRGFDTFVSAVVGLSATIRRCPQCDGLYAVTGAARGVPQEYCSPRCRNRSGVKRFREKQTRLNKGINH